MYLSVDGGGSKLRMLLADYGLNPVNSMELGGVNTNFMPERDARRAFGEAAERCIPQGAKLCHVCCSIF
jgi:N-acetylglucosamine kinase-like BadF-type ATPase